MKAVDGTGVFFIRGILKMENKRLVTNNYLKELQLGKVGKSTQGQCIRKNGKIFFINEDGTIKAVWED